MSRVLITGARAPVALHLARLFAAAGHAVVLADTQRFPLARPTRASSGYVRLPGPRDNLAAYGAALATALDRHSIDHVIPTCEEIFFLAALRDLHGLSIPLAAPPFAVLRAAHHKGLFAHNAAGLGADPPRTDVVDSPAALAAIPDVGRRVLKPAWSRFASRVHIAPDSTTLAKIVPTPADPWLVQDRMVGEEICAYAVAFAGRLVAFAAYRPLWRAGQGAGIAFEPVTDPAALAFVTGFAAQQSWTGQLSFDFRRDAAGALHVLECNPRATSGLHFFAPADDLPAALLTGRPTTPSDRKPMTVKLALLAYGLPVALREKRLGALATDLRAMTDLLAVPGDRRVVPGQFLALGEIAALALRKGVSLQQAATADIEWNGEALGP